MDNNLSKLQDLYLLVSTTDFQRTQELLKFVGELIDIEEDVWYDNQAAELNDPEAKYRSYLNG